MDQIQGCFELPMSMTLSKVPLLITKYLLNSEVRKKEGRWNKSEPEALVWQSNC